MKIGILTHQYINNYGAFLQAWALRKAISELFPEDEVQIMSGRIFCSERREESAVQGRSHTDLYDQNQAAACCGPAGEC